LATCGKNSNVLVNITIYLIDGYRINKSNNMEKEMLKKSYL